LIFGEKRTASIRAAKHSEFAILKFEDFVEVCVYVCVYVCMYVCMCVCVCVTNTIFGGSILIIFNLFSIKFNMHFICICFLFACVLYVMYLILIIIIIILLLLLLLLLCLCYLCVYTKRL